MSEHMKQTEAMAKHVEGFFTTREGRTLYGLAKESLHPIVEIGAYMGRSTVWLARGSQAGAGVPVITIDNLVGVPNQYIYGNRRKFSQPARVVNRGAKSSKLRPRKQLTQQEKFYRNIEAARVADLVTLVPTASQYAIKEVPRKVGVLFIDGGHEYEEVKLDFDLFAPLVVEGGWIAFHDLSWPGPARLIGEEITTEAGYEKQISITGEGSDLYVARKIKTKEKKRKSR